MPPVQACSGQREKAAWVAAQVCLCVLTALVMWDYVQLKASQSVGRDETVHALPRSLFQSSAGCSQMQKIQSQPQSPALITAAALMPVRLQPGIDNLMFKFKQDMKSREGPVLHKWDQYFDVYQRYFQRFVGKEVHMLEIGVQSGGSLEMWKSFFGPNLHYYGVDLNPYAKALFEELPNIQVFVGNQTDRAFWTRMRASIPKVNILLDDGGHSMEQQITTFQEMFQHVKHGGIYMTEDCSTSYEAGYGGGLKRNGSWIEFTKDLIDEGLNADYYNGRTDLTALITSIAYYDQIVVFEKGDHVNMSKFPARVGTMQMEYLPPTLANGDLDPKVLEELKRRFKKPLLT